MDDILKVIFVEEYNLKWEIYNELDNPVVEYKSFVEKLLEFKK